MSVTPIPSPYNIVQVGLGPLVSSDETEVYLVFAVRYLYRGLAPGTIQFVTSSDILGNTNFLEAWSYVEATTVNADSGYSGGELYQDAIVRSTDGGKTFGSLQPSLHQVVRERGLDDLFSIAGSIWESVDGGSTWSEVVPPPPDPYSFDPPVQYVYEHIETSTTHIYIDVAARGTE